MDTSGSPVPDAIQPLLEQLQECLVLETKYQPSLQLPVTTQNDEITIGARDSSAHVLRCLKVWYDLPSDVLFIAINLMDRFLTKMKARPKHMACISVSAFHIAAVQMAQQSLDADHLVSISQCKCTGGDLKRMSELISNKLEWAPGTQPITSLTFLRLFNLIFQAAATQLGLGELYASMVSCKLSIFQESELLLRLEMVACDGNCASLRPSEVALVLLCTYLDAAVKRLETNIDHNMPGPSTADNLPQPVHEMLRLVEFAAELQKMCKISDASFFATHEAVSAILNKYNAQEQTPHRQRLIWRLSSRTARLLRPTDKFTSVLPVIAEHTPTPSPKRIRKTRKFSRRQGHKRR